MKLSGFYESIPKRYLHCTLHHHIIKEKAEQQTHPQTFLFKGNIEIQDPEVTLDENITHFDRSFKNIKEVIRT